MDLKSLNQKGMVSKLHYPESSKRKLKQKPFTKKKIKIRQDKAPEPYLKAILDEEVFQSPSFNEHVKKVSLNTKIDEETVKEVLISYFTNIVFAINAVRKVKTKINVYGFFSLIVKKGIYNTKTLKS